MVEFTELTDAVYKCERCEHEWRPRVECPSYCPHCGVCFIDGADKYGFFVSNNNGSFIGIIPRKTNECDAVRKKQVVYLDDDYRVIPSVDIINDVEIYKEHSIIDINVLMSFLNDALKKYSFYGDFAKFRFSIRFHEVVKCELYNLGWKLDYISCPEFKTNYGFFDMVWIKDNKVKAVFEINTLRIIANIKKGLSSLCSPSFYHIVIKFNRISSDIVDVDIDK